MRQKVHSLKGKIVHGGRHQQWHLVEVDYLGAIYVYNGDFICRIKKSPKDRSSSCPDLHMIQDQDIYCF